MAGTQKAGKKNRKLGRASREPKHVRYNANNTRLWNKAKRILQSNGEKFLIEWSKEHNCQYIARAVIDERSKV